MFGNAVDQQQQQQTSAPLIHKNRQQKREQGPKQHSAPNPSHIFLINPHALLRSPADVNKVFERQRKGAFQSD